MRRCLPLSSAALLFVRTSGDNSLHAEEGDFAAACVAKTRTTRLDKIMLLTLSFGFVFP